MEVRPGRAGAMVDSPDGVVVTGAPPGGLVTIETTLDFCGQHWTCSGELVAGRDGEVETARDASTGGSYTGVDPYGLFWSAEVPGLYEWGVLHPMRVSVRATCEELSVETSYRRPALTAGVTEHVVAETEAKGRLFVPDAGGRGVVILAGSDGGPGGPLMGALLAGHGLPTLSLAHWNHPGTPDAMQDIDIEVVARACGWLRAQNGVDDVPPAVIGLSRGGELALLTATLFPDRVGPVASLVGSGVPWGAFGPGADDNDTAWLFEGEPVPKIYEHTGDSEAELDVPESVAAAEIAIEKAAGPVLLLSGEDDAMWSSARLSRIAESRAARVGAADRVTHVAYPQAGHWCTTPPGFPLASEIDHPVDGVHVAIGGTRSGNQAARVDSWRRLRDHIGATR